MGEYKVGSALVVGKRNAKVNNIVQILSKHFKEVNQIRDFTPGDAAYPGKHVSLIVLTDWLDDRFDRELAVNLRNKFPKAKFMGLLEKINQETEISLRSVGLVFLGSYDYFSQYSTNILRSALATGRALQREKDEEYRFDCKKKRA